MIQGYMARTWLPKVFNIRRGADLRRYLSDDVLMGLVPKKNKVTSYLPDKRRLLNDWRQTEVILPVLPALTSRGDTFPILPQINLTRKHNTIKLRHKTAKSVPLAMREEHRRRYREHKLGGAKFHRHYTNFLSLVNRTYGRYDDLVDLGVAYKLSDGNLLEFGQNALAMELADRAIGTKAQLLKRHIYSQPWYKSPFGIGTTKKLIDNVF